MLRRLIQALFVVAALSVAVLTLMWRSTSSRASQLKVTADSLRSANASLAASYDSLMTWCSDVEKQSREPMLLHRIYVEQLRRAGLTDPVKNLRDDLRAKQEIIPLEPHGQQWLLGPIAILSSRWVYAEFNDGHYAGGCLLEYSVTGGQIEWKVIKAELL
jgi:hypothetical protein